LKNKTQYVIVVKGLCFSVLLAMFLNFIFYPQLMQYQAGMVAGKWQQKNLPNSSISMFNCDEYSFQFYGNTSFQFVINASDLFKKNNTAIVFIKKHEIPKINADSFSIRALQSFSHFHISMLNAKFINHKTRSQTLDTMQIVEIKRMN
jgi:hypothetical protein